MSGRESMNAHEKYLRLLAADIRASGHHGWSNTAEWAADEIKSLTRRVMELELELAGMKPSQRRRETT